MVQYGFPIQQAGQGEPWYQFFGHYILNPFRPSIESAWKEDRNTPFVYVPSGPVIGKKGEHFGLYQDFSLPNAKRMFLLLYLNWRYSEKFQDYDKIWTFGFASHVHDISKNSQTRKDLLDFVEWINNTFTNKYSSNGNLISKWAGRKEIYEEFLKWEKRNPNQSSFNYPTNSKDYNFYPYLKEVQENFENLYYDKEIFNFREDGIYAHRLISNMDKKPIYVLWKEDGEGTVDLSFDFNNDVEVVYTISGEKLILNPSEIKVGEEAIIVKNECKHKRPF